MIICENIYFVTYFSTYWIKNYSAETIEILQGYCISLNDFKQKILNGLECDKKECVEHVTFEEK